MWPFKKKEQKKYNCYHWMDDPWRECWWRVTPGYGVGMTCQCEEGDHKWYRNNCPIHGSNGKELYDEATEYGRW